MTIHRLNQAFSFRSHFHSSWIRNSNILSRCKEESETKQPFLAWNLGTAVSGTTVNGTLTRIEETDLGQVYTIREKKNIRMRHNYHVCIILTPGPRFPGRPLLPARPMSPFGPGSPCAPLAPSFPRAPRNPSLPSFPREPLRPLSP